MLLEIRSLFSLTLVPLVYAGKHGRLSITRIWLVPYKVNRALALLFLPFPALRLANLYLLVYF
jgi:hypothetical protein